MIRVVQKEALVEQLSVLLDQLDVAHDMEYLAVLVLHPILHTHRILHILQHLYAVEKLGFILFKDSTGDHVEAIRQQFLLGLIAQELQGSPVDAEDTGAVQGVAHHPAVHGGKDHL